MKILSRLVLLSLAVPGWSATGDILAVRIASATAHNGWIAEIDIDSLGTGGTYNFGLADSGYSVRNDPSGAKIVFTVTSPGYDTSGGTTTIQRTVYGVWWMRKAYPNQAQADESVNASTLTVRVVLSDYIYSGDTATVDIAAGFYTEGGVPNNAASGFSVTNNSTQAYPKSVCRWATVPYQQVTGDFTIEAVCFHRHYQSYRPLAAVKFTCQDEATPTPNSATVTVNWMLPSPAASQYGDRHTVLTYAATIPVSGLNQGDVLTCNFIAYPWVGDSGALVDTSGGTSDNETLGPLLMLNDKNGTYGGAWAVVDATNGQASTATTWVYATQAAAESAYASDNTNSYNTVGRAVQAIKAYNNANYSRDNPGGGVALCTGNIAIPGTTPASDLGVMETWFTVRPISTGSCTVNSLSIASLKVRRLRYASLSFSNSGSTISGSSTTDILWMDGNTINMTGTAPIAGWRLAYGTGNTVSALTGGFTHFSTNKSPWALLRGNEFTGTTNLSGALYASFGNKKIFPVNYERGNAPGHLFSDNGIFAFNSVFKAGSSFGVWDTCSGNPDQVIGWALVQNVWEREPLDAQPLLTVANRTPAIRRISCSGTTRSSGSARTWDTTPPARRPITAGCGQWSATSTRTGTTRAISSPPRIQTVSAAGPSSTMSARRATPTPTPASRRPSMGCTRMTGRSWWMAPTRCLTWPSPSIPPRRTTARSLGAAMRRTGRSAATPRRTNRRRGLVGPSMGRRRLQTIRRMVPGMEPGAANTGWCRPRGCAQTASGWAFSRRHTARCLMTWPGGRAPMEPPEPTTWLRRGGHSNAERENPEWRELVLPLRAAISAGGEAGLPQ
ncbi:MAG TPA: hypothetical protein VNN17_05585 [Terriglobia bacterium]|nr:hypothetical protein [Terriglobia bacterium]